MLGADDKCLVSARTEMVWAGHIAALKSSSFKTVSVWFDNLKYELTDPSANITFNKSAPKFQTKSIKDDNKNELIE